jgi:TatD DNase family protein
VSQESDTADSRKVRTFPGVRYTAINRSLGRPAMKPERQDEGILRWRLPRQKSAVQLAYVSLKSFPHGFRLRKALRYWLSSSLGAWQRVHCSSGNAAGWTHCQRGRHGRCLSHTTRKAGIRLVQRFQSGRSFQACEALPAELTTTMAHRYFDAAANLTDEAFLGVYNGKRYHEPDLDRVLERAAQENVREVLVTAGSLDQSKEALLLVRENRKQLAASSATSLPKLFATVGVHPTRCSEFFPKEDTASADAEAHAREHLHALRALIEQGVGAAGGTQAPDENLDDDAVVAIGECGLDYVRTQFCPPAVQQRGFKLQLQLAGETGLPLLLHNRESTADLVQLLTENRHQIRAGGLVHSFDGSAEEAAMLLDLGFHLGVNGCSLKTEENLRVVRESIPLDRLILETDCPYCELRPSHASYQFMHKQGIDIAGYGWAGRARADKKRFCTGVGVRGRNEPCSIVQICAVVSSLKGVPMAHVAEATRRNALSLFRCSEAV